MYNTCISLKSGDMYNTIRVSIRNVSSNILMIITVSIVHHLENKEKGSCMPCFAAQAAAIEYSFGTGK